MTRALASLALAFALGAATLAGAAPEANAQGARTVAGKGEKVCRYKFPTGERRVWVCKKDEPCCAWDAIKYVKCGSAVFKCL